jgi:hypothetical protein
VKDVWELNAACVGPIPGSGAQVGCERVGGGRGRVAESLEVGCRGANACAVCEEL